MDDNGTQRSDEGTEPSAHMDHVHTADAHTAQPGEPVLAKWLLDGCSNLFEVASALRAHAERFEQLADQGWTLVQPVEDGFSVLVDPQGDPGDWDHEDDEELDEHDG